MDSEYVVWFFNCGVFYVLSLMFWGDEFYLFEDCSFFFCLCVVDGKLYYLKNCLLGILNFSVLLVGVVD